MSVSIFLQDVTFALCGFVLYLSAGSNLICVSQNRENVGSVDSDDCKEILKSLGSISIVLSLLYFWDAIWSGLVMRRHSGYITIPISPLISERHSNQPNRLQSQISTASGSNNS